MVINYTGLHKRKNYEQLLDYLQNNQDMIRYPDRFAKQMRNHPYLTQFDSDEFGIMDEQQKEIKKQEVIKAAMMSTASGPSGPSTTDILSRPHVRPPPSGFGAHLDTRGSFMPINEGDDEVEMPNVAGILNRGGPRGSSSIRPGHPHDPQAGPTIIRRMLLNGGPDGSSSIRPGHPHDPQAGPTIIRRMLLNGGPDGSSSIRPDHRGDSQARPTILRRILLNGGPNIISVRPDNEGDNEVEIPRSIRSIHESSALPDALSIRSESFRSMSNVDVDPSDFGSLVSDFMHDVVNRHDEQRSSVSEGSFAETPSFLKPSATPIISSNLMKQLEQSKNDKINEELERNAMYLQDADSKKLRDNYKNRDADMDLVKSIDEKTQTDSTKVIDLFAKLEESQKDKLKVEIKQLYKFYKQYDLLESNKYQDAKTIDIKQLRVIFGYYEKIVDAMGKDPHDYTGEEAALIASGKKTKRRIEKTTTLSKEYMLRTLKKFFVKENMYRDVKKSTASSSSGVR